MNIDLVDDRLRYIMFLHAYINACLQVFMHISYMCNFGVEKSIVDHIMSKSMGPYIRYLLDDLFLDSSSKVV